MGPRVNEEARGPIVKAATLQNKKPTVGSQFRPIDIGPSSDPSLIKDQSPGHANQSQKIKDLGNYSGKRSNEGPTSQALNAANHPTNALNGTKLSDTSTKKYHVVKIPNKSKKEGKVNNSKNSSRPK